MAAVGETFDLGMNRALALVCIALALSASAEEPAWETVVKGPITVKNRARADSDVKEVWAEGEIAAPVREIQQTLMSPENFKNFMPYLKVSRTLSKEPDGSTVVYTELALPIVTSRDYVVQVWLDESVQHDGSGAFANHWSAMKGRLPERANLIRVKTNDGSWYVTPTGDGSTSWAVYKFAADPGGWVPSFAGNYGNERGVPETFKAVEKEALRLKAQRLLHPAATAAK